MPPMSISIVSVNEHRNLRQAFKVLRINQRVHSQWPQSTAEIQNANAIDLNKGGLFFIERTHCTSLYLHDNFIDL